MKMRLVTIAALEQRMGTPVLSDEDPITSHELGSFALFYHATRR